MDAATLDGVDVAGRRVLLRADLNVPIEDGRITDLTRIERLTPTIRELAGKGARLIVVSHFGRPKGGPSPDLSLRPLATALGEVLGRPVAFAADSVGPVAEEAVAALGNGDILLLENTRFHPEEEANDEAFAAKLASLADIFVNDAFSAVHRAHASTEAVARLLPSYAGRLMEAELNALTAALGRPIKPVMAIVGGAKVSTKIDLLANLVRQVQILVIGGAMANTFLAARGLSLGRSLLERDMGQTVAEIVSAAAAAGCEIMLPIDCVVAGELKANASTSVVPVEAVPDGAMVLDIGPATVDRISSAMRNCRTLIWNGPVGAFETAPFDAGTVALAHEVARLTQAGELLSVAGGGDTVAALRAAGAVDRLTYVSTAGGAFLEWMEGKTLPGILALSRGAAAHERK
jgi:phosphoglycerate kinase